MGDRESLFCNVTVPRVVMRPFTTGLRGARIMRSGLKFSRHVVFPPSRPLGLMEMTVDGASAPDRGRPSILLPLLSTKIQPMTLIKGPSSLSL